VVDHPDVEEAACACGSHLERARIVACGVLKQVHERLANHRLVDLDRRQMPLDIDLHEATAERGAQGAGLDPRCLEQVRDEPCQTLGLAVEVGEHRVAQVRVEI
jgi:hypothetical protein